MAESTRERERTALQLASRQTRTEDLPAPTTDEYDEGLVVETVAAVLGQASRKGEWEPADITRVFAFCGQADLDFTRALLPPGVTEVQAYTLCGSARIVVPEGLEVEVTGSALLGEFKQSTRVSRARRLLRRTLRAARGDVDYEDEPEVEEDPPLLRVTGLALLGGVKVATR